jgi:general stress protein YciG
MTDEPDYPVKKPRGFAAMDLERRTEIARRGGNSVANENRYYSRNVAAASAAGRKGAAARSANYLARAKSVSESGTEQ